MTFLDLTLFREIARKAPFFWILAGKWTAYLQWLTNGKFRCVPFPKANALHGNSNVYILRFGCVPFPDASVRVISRRKSRLWRVISRSTRASDFPTQSAFDFPTQSASDFLTQPCVWFPGAEIMRVISRREWLWNLFACDFPAQSPRSF